MKKATYFNKNFLLKINSTPNRTRSTTRHTICKGDIVLKSREELRTEDEFYVDGGSSVEDYKSLIIRKVETY